VVISPGFIVGCILGYFSLLLVIAWFTSRKATNAAYFLGNKNSPWLIVAFGLLGDSLSGVTFISVPGQVSTAKFSYLQIVLGYVLGYIVIAQVLLPLYYRLNLTSIYGYLRERYGPASQKTGALFFLLSRTTGAAARLYLAATVLQLFVFDHWHFPFWLTVASIIALMLVYTYRGGIKTLVWTDSFQSAFLLMGLVLSVVAISRELNLGAMELFRSVYASDTSQVFFWDWRERNFFWKQFISGAFTAIAMTGLDQNMMQKNLSCRSLRDAQKNIYAFTAVMVFVNVLFLALGTLLFQYAQAKQIAIPARTDELFPMLALRELGAFAAIVFILGLTAATFSSADSVLTTLTTSFCLDVLGMESAEGTQEKAKTRLRHQVHIGFAALLLLVILGFKWFNSKAIIDAVFTLATFTYGPLLGLFGFGLFTRIAVRDKLAPWVCCLPPLLCYAISANSQRWLGGYKFGFELLPLNGALTFLGLWLIRKPPHSRV
jgi:Na+/proline symporter